MTPASLEVIVIKKGVPVIDSVESSISERSVSEVKNLYLLKDPFLRRDDTRVLGKLLSFRTERSGVKNLYLVKDLSVPRDDNRIFVKVIVLKKKPLSFRTERSGVKNLFVWLSRVKNQLFGERSLLRRDDTCVFGSNCH